MEIELLIQKYELKKNLLIEDNIHALLEEQDAFEDFDREIEDIENTTLKKVEIRTQP